MNTLMAIDPGKHAVGWAFFTNGVLTDCGYELFRSLREISFWVGTRGPDRLVIEKPQPYTTRPEALGDVVDLAVVVGALAVGPHRPHLHLVTPREWKGQVPKSVMARRIRQRLSHDEKRAIPDLPRGKLHNAVDAIGIGLYSLGRL